MPASQQLPASSLFVTAGLAAFYLLPSLIALARGVRGVVRLNMLTGWTGVGWLVALTRACQRRARVTLWR